MDKKVLCLLVSALISFIPPNARRDTRDYTRVSPQVGLSKDEVSKYRIGRRMSSFLSAIKKVGLNTVSSAAGTATVLGVHSAFVPSGDTPKVVDSQLYNPVFETEKSLLNFNLGDSGTFLLISASCLALALVGLCAAQYCGCSPSARRARRERAEYQRLVREGEARFRERALLHSQELQELEESAGKLSRLKELQEKRRLEHPSSEDEGLTGVKSTPGDAINISSSSSSEASTSVTERVNGREATNPGYGSNPKPMDY